MNGYAKRGEYIHKSTFSYVYMHVHIYTYLYIYIMNICIFSNECEDV